MVITHKELVDRRRDQAFELHYMGMSSREIAAALGCSFKTVCNDLAWHEHQANQEIKEHKKHIALEYKEAKANFEYLRKKAWQQFTKADKEGDEDRKIQLYPILESLNANILAIIAAGDIIDKELIEHAKQQARQIEEEGLNKTIDKGSRRTN